MNVLNQWLEELYQELDNKLPFKGVSLYKG